MYTFETEIKRVNDMQRLHDEQKANVRVIAVTLGACVLATLGIAVAIAMCAAKAEAQEWHSTNQISVTWDAVTQHTDGTPITGEITYDLFIGPVDQSSQQEIATGVAATQHTITFNQEGRWLVGLRTVKTLDGEIMRSVVGWSIDVEVAPDPFGVLFLKSPAGVKGLSIASE
jgi:hypothetical protein